MAERLYPPHIAGSLPAFYKTYDSTGKVVNARIDIPYSMNQGVGIAQIDGFVLRIKNVSSGSYVFPPQYSKSYDPEKNLVSFNITSQHAELLQEGQFYKAQLAYYNDINVTLDVGFGDSVVAESYGKQVGFYSTVGIIKCVSYPRVVISDFSIDSINLFTGQFFGIYDQTQSSDQTEKVYSYQFDIYDDEDNLYYSTGERIHNNSNDVNYNMSVDELRINDFIKNNEVYKIIYTVTTMNGLVVSSPYYKITSQTLLAPTKVLDIITKPNPDEAYITISFKGEETENEEGIMKEDAYYGEYVLQRSCEEDGYTEWVELHRFRLQDQKPSEIKFKDFTIKQGVKYKYGVQQFNMWKIVSSRLESDPISIDYEDMFLLDGEHQLKIRFNPKVAKFKTDVLEQKVETIGSKYPFIFRNGKVEYKEFTISGLISYQMDNARLFYHRDPDLKLLRTRTSEEGNVDYENEDDLYNFTDLTERNILWERRFKLAVLDWLNNGKPKMFKSGPEGNYIVRLLKVDLKPTDKLGRMLHTFNCTAYEIADFTYDNLLKYGFATKTDISKFVFLWKSYNFADYPAGENIEIIFEQEVKEFTLQDLMPGTLVQLYYENQKDPLEIIIGATGSYRFEGSNDKIVKLVIPVNPGEKINGIVECQYMGLRYSKFDAIKDIKLKTIVGQQFVGVKPELMVLQKQFAETSEDEDGKESWTHIDFSNPMEDYLSSLNTRLYLNARDEGSETTDIYSALRPDFYGGDIIQYINSSINNFQDNKIRILNLELAHFQARDLIPIYLTPYDLVDESLWIQYELSHKRRRPDKSEYESLTLIPNDSLDYEQRLSWFMFSVTPFGDPYPMDKFIPFFKETAYMNDAHCIFEMLQYNAEDDLWEPLNNPDWPGHYYDPYYKVMIGEYNTTILIDKEKVTKDEDALINLEYTRDLTLNNLGVVKSIVIGSGIIANLTFQLEILDYYTEENDPETAAAKQKYLDASSKLSNVMESYEIIKSNDIQALKNKALWDLYVKLVTPDKVELTQSELLVILALLNKYDLTQDEVLAILAANENDIENLFINGTWQTYQFENVLHKFVLTQKYSADKPALDKGYQTTLESNILSFLKDKNTYNDLNIVNRLELDDITKVINNIPLENLAEKLQEIININAEIDVLRKDKEKEKDDLIKQYEELKNQLKTSITLYNRMLRQWYALHLITDELLRPFNEKEAAKKELEGKTGDELIQATAQFDQKYADYTTPNPSQTFSQIYAMYGNQKDILEPQIQKQLSTQDYYEKQYKAINEKTLELLEEIRVHLFIQSDRDDDLTLDDYITELNYSQIESILVSLNQLRVLKQQFSSFEEVSVTIEETLKEFKIDVGPSGEKIVNKLVTLINSLLRQIRLQVLPEDNATSPSEIIKALNKEFQKVVVFDTKTVNILYDYIIAVDKIENIISYLKSKGIDFNAPDIEDYKEFRSTVLNEMTGDQKGQAQRLIFEFNNSSSDSEEEKILYPPEYSGVYKFRDKYYLGDPSTTDVEKMQERVERIKYVLDYARQFSNTFETRDNINYEDIALEIRTSYLDSVDLFNPNIRNLLMSMYGQNGINDRVDNLNKFIGTLKIDLDDSESTQKNWDKYVEEFLFAEKVNLLRSGQYQLVDSNYPSNFQNLGTDFDYMSFQKNVFLNKFGDFKVNEKDIDENSIISSSTGMGLLSVDDSYKDNKSVYIFPKEAFKIYNIDQIKQDFMGLSTVDIKGEVVETGILYWYINLIIQGLLDYYEELFNQSSTLINDYTLRAENYNTKAEKYREKFEQAQSILDGYKTTENLFQYEYYLNDSVSTGSELNKYIQQSKNAWNDFILALDRGYRNELARGMYC